VSSFFGSAIRMHGDNHGTVYVAFAGAAIKRSPTAALKMVATHR